MPSECGVMMMIVSALVPVVVVDVLPKTTRRTNGVTSTTKKRMMNRYRRMFAIMRILHLPRRHGDTEQTNQIRSLFFSQCLRASVAHSHWTIQSRPRRPPEQIPRRAPAGPLGAG